MSATSSVGGVAEGWTAYNISADPRSGIGDWSADELLPT